MRVSNILLVGNLNLGFLYIREFIDPLSYGAFMYIHKPKKDHIPF